MDTNRNDDFHVGTTLSSIFKMYAANIWANLFFCVLLLGIPSIIFSFVDYRIAADFFLAAGTNLSELSQDIFNQIVAGNFDFSGQTTALLTELTEALAPMNLLGFVVRLFLTPLATGALIRSVTSRIVGGDGNINDSLTWALSNYGSLFAARFCAGLFLIGISTLAVILISLLIFVFSLLSIASPLIAIPLLVVFLLFACAFGVNMSILPSAAVTAFSFESQRGFQAVKHGFYIIRKKFWRCACVVFVIALVVGITEYIIQYITGALLSFLGFVPVFINSLAALVLESLPYLAAVLIYARIAALNAAELNAVRSDEQDSLPPSDYL